MGWQRSYKWYTSMIVLIKYLYISNSLVVVIVLVYTSSQPEKISIQRLIVWLMGLFRLCICKAEFFNQFKKTLALLPNHPLNTRLDYQHNDAFEMSFYLKKWVSCNFFSLVTAKTYRQYKKEAIQYNKAKEQFRTVFNTWLEKPTHLEEFSWKLWTW